MAVLFCIECGRFDVRVDKQSENSISKDLFRHFVTVDSVVIVAIIFRYASDTHVTAQNEIALARWNVLPSCASMELLSLWTHSSQHLTLMAIDCRALSIRFHFSCASFRNRMWTTWNAILFDSNNVFFSSFAFEIDCLFWLACSATNRLSWRSEYAFASLPEASIDRTGSKRNGSFRRQNCFSNNFIFFLMDFLLCHFAVFNLNRLEVSLEYSFVCLFTQLGEECNSLCSFNTQRQWQCSNDGKFVLFLSGREKKNHFRTKKCRNRIERRHFIDMQKIIYFTFDWNWRNCIEQPKEMNVTSQKHTK